MQERSKLFVYDPQVKREQVRVFDLRSDELTSAFVIASKLSKALSSTSHTTCFARHSQMLIEFDYTLNVNKTTEPDLDKLILTSPSAYDACEGAHAIAILTEWDEFKTLDYQRIYEKMAKPAFVFDGRNIVDQAALRKIGFEVYSIGKPLSQA